MLECKAAMVSYTQANRAKRVLQQHGISSAIYRLEHLGPEGCGFVQMESQTGPDSHHAAETEGGTDGVETDAGMIGKDFDKSFLFYNSKAASFRSTAFAWSLPLPFNTTTHLPKNALR